MPSWALPLLPQQRTPPAVVSAQVCESPVLTAAKPPAMSALGGRGWGTGSSSFVPSPSWPWLLLPQQRTPPPIISAQVCAPPAAIACTPDSTSEFGGRERSALAPSP